ncbi:IS600 ORF1 [Shigella sonnei]|nr:IS600 ORF1 [Shigella sonnei]
MSRKTQRYSKEFKAEAVRTVLENQLSISEGASRLCRKSQCIPVLLRWLHPGY